MKRLIFLSVLLSGCAAQMIAKPGATNLPYAPVNDSERVGTIRYPNSPGGNESMRKDAYKQMFDACAGKYRIVSEGPQGTPTTSTMTTATGVQTTTSTDEYWYINFKCEQ